MAIILIDPNNAFIKECREKRQQHIPHRAHTAASVAKQIQYEWLRSAEHGVQVSDNDPYSKWKILF